MRYLFHPGVFILKVAMRYGSRDDNYEILRDDPNSDMRFRGKSSSTVVYGNDNFIAQLYFATGYRYCRELPILLPLVFSRESGVILSNWDDSRNSIRKSANFTEYSF